jgi:glycosyltransferase involved in cell wall biosynthesis
LPANHPEVSVVVPHLNQPDYLETCLASLDQQSLPAALFEVLVVDNGSALRPDDVIARHPRARLLTEATPGPGPARNTGVAHAAGEIVAFIDADCRAHTDWLRTAIDRLRTEPVNSILGGDVRIWHEPRRSLTAIEAYESVFAYLFKRYIERRGFSGTGNLVLRRRDFHRVGPFAGISIAEDIDWGHRACAAGFTFRYIPEMIVFHPARKSFGELRAKWDRHLRHYINMARGKPFWRSRWILKAVAVLVSPAIDCLKILTSDRLHGTLNRLKALLILIAIRGYRAWIMIKLLWTPNEIVWNRDTEINLPETR